MRVDDRLVAVSRRVLAMGLTEVASGCWMPESYPRPCPGLAMFHVIVPGWLVDSALTQGD
jgi:hypothetical protein